MSFLLKSISVGVVAGEVFASVGPHHTSGQLARGWSGGGVRRAGYGPCEGMLKFYGGHTVRCPLRKSRPEGEVAVCGLLGDTGRAGGGRGMSYTQHREGGGQGSFLQVRQIVLIKLHNTFLMFL